MKVLLCCAGGLSSSILMKKMKTWADAHGEDLEIQAMGTGEAVETWQNGYECVLLAPQVSYRLKQLQEEIKLPIAEVPSLDYAIGNAENVMKLAHKLCDNKDAKSFAVKIIRAKDYADMSRKAANIISAQVIMKPNCVLGLATGGTPVGAYKQLVEWYNKGDINFFEVTTVNLDE